jgi:hypothetical protein
VQTILVVSKSTVITPLALKVMCSCSLINALDPSEPRATNLLRSVWVRSSPRSKFLKFSEWPNLVFPV